MPKKEYPDIPLPEGMQDMKDGEETDKVCTVRRDGDKLCFVAVEGRPIGEGEDESHEEAPPEQEATEGGQEQPSPGDMFEENFRKPKGRMAMRM